MARKTSGNSKPRKKRAGGKKKPVAQRIVREATPENEDRGGRFAHQGGRSGSQP